ncbi:aerotolerance regulator BatA [candidate division KSB1 bacterium]|nr:MAG: aerotolerance regulator BatA [candidate division KSB1 bacterium 4484_219]RKY76854.1 MAG: aerotolerance regulator BatA [candidate division KSB1 bacterium]
MFRFANPEFLLLLIVIPYFVYWHFHKGNRRSVTLQYPNLELVKAVGSSRWNRYRHILFGLRILALALLIIALARPQSGAKQEEITTEGIDIILAMDISSSMLAEDFKPKNRLEAAKVVAAKFVRGRKNDRIGMVIFARQSFTQCPLTLDYGIVQNFIKDIRVGLIEDGTAIGMAIANCVNRLRDSKAKSKVVILLTDGVNNAGELDPITAAQIAKAMGIRIYTIGAGSKGTALYPVDDPFFGRRYLPMQVEIDEKLLKEVARITGGKYFRATDRKSLEQIYDEIGKMEKTKIEVKEFTRYAELFVYFLIAGLGALVLELVLTNTKFRKIP